MFETHALFISSDFWQPDRDQWKSVLTLVALVLAVVNVALMRVIWVKAFGFKDGTYKTLSRIHRALGYSAFGIMVFIAVVTCIGIIGYGGYGTRPTWHSYLGITVLAMMGIKIFAVRRGLPEGGRFRTWAIVVSVAGTVFLAILAGTSMDSRGSYVLPLFPLAALAGFILWKRFGPLPVVGAGMLASMALLFVTSGGWWFQEQVTRGEGPDVASVTALKGNIEEGASVFYAAGCRTCHGDTGEGGFGPSLRSANFAYRNTPESIAQRVRGGGGSMPAFGKEKISDQQLASLVLFVRNWYQK